MNVLMIASDASLSHRVITCRRQSRATWLEHAPMELRVSRREIQQGLQEHPNAPQLLMTWLTQHAVAHASALDDVDV